ncbi:MAG: hypothetical protein JWN41_91 [Thermoleophilia bacterium]|nr:hypothetical protein [Thermoleophilia bacterium]
MTRRPPAAENPKRAPLTSVLRVSRETVLAPVHAWRIVSRFLPARCRYHPSCSTYALTAVRRHGVFLGAVLSVWRILRCNPWSAGGVDHVPAKIDRRSK